MSTPLSNARGIYAVVDPDFCRLPPQEVVTGLIRGGVSVVQLRMKDASDREILMLAKVMADQCRRADISFVVNDRADIAALVQADGVHLGQHDLSIEEARCIFPAGTIGLSTHDLAQAKEAERLGANWIGYGPVFETTSKKNPDPTQGVSALKSVSEHVAIPVIAIGGINPTNISELVGACDYAAMISALCSVDDPERAARELVNTFCR